MRPKPFLKLHGTKAGVRQRRHGRKMRDIQHQRKPLQTYSRSQLQRSTNVHKRLFAPCRVRQTRPQERFKMRGLIEIGYEIVDALKVIKTEEEYKKALSLMDRLFDYTEGPVANLADVLAVLIEKYEEEHYPIEEANGVDVLRFLMEQNGLKQKDLVGVLGGKSTVSEILNEKRPLNIKHANALAEMLHVSPATFV